MKKRLYLLMPVLTIASFFMFSWHLNALARLISSDASYFIHRLIMVLWLAIPGFSLELPRLWPYFTGKAKGHTDWWFLLINGVPALFFAWLPFFVYVFSLQKVLPALLMTEQARILVEAVGAFWLGITLGKSISLDA